MVDFMDLDWSFTSNGTSRKLIVLLHGLEGNAQRPYITGTAKYFNQRGYDACAVNFRSCSGVTNLLYQSYHSGVTNDLAEIFRHISTKKYNIVVAKGFSLGGNVLLKYLGEERQHPSIIKAAVGVSVPCDLYGSMIKLHQWYNLPYAIRFRKNLIDKLRLKQSSFPDYISDELLEKIETLRDFDELYTSKAHGFDNALDYYTKCSSLSVLHNINIPTLILNAANDSFLSSSCYPISIAKEHKTLFLETTEYGGHVGFYDIQNTYYNEKRSFHFVEEIAGLSAE